MNAVVLYVPYVREQKVLAARNFQLERQPFQDPYIYQYGLLPEQCVPRRYGRLLICMHVAFYPIKALLLSDLHSLALSRLLVWAQYPDSHIPDF